VAGYELEFEDRFDGDALDTGRWVPHYLPQWSTPELTAARYSLGDGCLRLRIEEDQPPWCPELDGEVRVSSLQTGVFAGPVGSAAGQHRFNPGAVVRSEQENEAAVGMGVHPFGDPGITDEFAAEPVPIDAREFRVYRADWTPKELVVDYVRGYRHPEFRT
jgi:hypothetical protein